MNLQSSNLPPYAQQLNPLHFTLLLQHAHNPVDWREWGTEALEKAEKEDKPILVSIGYSSCHWCHVMERESFEVEGVAKIMNDFFVCIKVDREERPDIDQIYMEAVQALGVNGGWPLNVFLTPQQKPFFGGTYFSQQAWVQILNNIHKAYVNNRKQLEDTAEELSLHLLRSDVERFKQLPNSTDWETDIEAIFKKLESRFDSIQGGMDRAPKFIMPSVWQFLLRYYHLTHSTNALNQINLTLNKIAEGGIYDQVGGGFARYSVDAYWFAPHFEKMLYDNAQLLSLYSEAYQITKDESYKKILYETFGWLQREMTNENGGFYSALDADSEGVEGQYYVWTKSDLEQILGKDEKIISAYYGVTAEGNWEHGNNILKKSGPDDLFLTEFNNPKISEWQTILKNAKDKLLAQREKRIKPGLDDKVVTAWNAMTVCGLIDAFKAFGDTRFLDAALKNIWFIENELTSGNVLCRSYKGKPSVTQGFLDDYAYVIQAQLKLYQVTFDEHWIDRAVKLMEHVLQNFYDPTDDFFFYTSIAAEKLITRKKEIFDNVIPSSNAIMTQNLFHLGTFIDKNEWKDMARSMTGSLSNIIISEPNYMSQWAIVATEINKGLKEVLMTGRGIRKFREELQKDFYPFILMQGSEGKSSLPLFEGKEPIEGKDTIYVCYQKTCQLPVHTLEEARNQLK
ncbi:MAG: thioredoxin domain-containing protein [Marivirga sp.]|nr:thioredoxin domain-containing protein [Marivirga sp.]